MAVFNSLTFDGENSLDYGVYITGEAVYNAPERAVEMISIPGRNGAIALDQGRFENIEVTYPAGTFGDDQPEFASKIRAFRNALASRFNYVKLTDSYHPDEYRLGLYKSGLTTTPVQRSKAGEFPIVFNCKPQRFLTSGETEVDGNAWSNVQTGSGSIVTIDNADGETGVKSLVANIEPIQSGSGTPSPTNVRPISGWDSVKVSRTSKNLFNANVVTDGVYLDVDGEIHSSATFCVSDYIGVNAGTLYYSGASSGFGSNPRTCFYDESKNFLSAVRPTTTSGTITVPSGASYIRLTVPVANKGTFQLEIGSSATAYEPFGDTYTTALGRTVYKGTLDVSTGLLTVTHLAVDMGSLSWTAMAGQGGSIYYMRTTDLASTIYRVASSDVVADLYSDAYVAKKNNTIYAGVVGVASTASGYVTVYDDRYNTASSASAFKTAVTGQTLVYPLATPQVYQLAPEEVGLLLGTNNIWADSGDITVQYGNSPVYNPTEFDAKPLIKVVGIGTAVVGDTAITITGTAGQTIYIDCDSMEIYKLNGGTPQSAASLVSFSGNDFPKLKAGSNTVALGTGITSVTITPRWWII